MCLLDCLFVCLFVCLRAWLFALFVDCVYLFVFVCLCACPLFSIVRLCFSLFWCVYVFVCMFCFGIDCLSVALLVSAIVCMCV